MTVKYFERKNHDVIWKSEDKRLEDFYEFLEAHKELDRGSVYQDLVDVYEELDNELTEKKM